MPYPKQLINFKFQILITALLVSGCAPRTVATPPPLVAPTATSAEAAPSTNTPAVAESQAPDATATPLLTATPESLTAISRLTDAGCCAQPFWSADSVWVLFIDKPEPTSLTAIYGVPVTGGAPQIVSEQVGILSPDGRYLTFRNDQKQTIVREVSSGQDSVIDNGGRRPFFSPTSQHLVWAVTIEESSSDFSQRRTIISISNVDGSDTHELITIYGGGIAGWLDDNRLLLAGRLEQGDPNTLIFAYNLTDNTTRDVVREERIRNVTVAPGGEWVLYTVALDPTNSANDGLWVVRADGTQRFKVEVVGSARWRDSSHLLIIPLDPGAPSHRLWQFDAATGKATSLTDPAVTPFRVSQGDWSVAPNGKYAVFVNAEDQSLWLITLPPS